MVDTPAGWYPQEDGRQRYWDGEKWTEHFAPGGGQATAVTGNSALAEGTSVTGVAQTDSRPWFKKKRFILPAGGVGAIILISALNGGGSDQPDTPAALVGSVSTAASQTTAAAATTSPTPAVTPSATPKAAPTKTAAPKPAAPKPAAPKLTVAQENAKGTAEDYLDYSGFSKKGLIKQLDLRATNRRTSTPPWPR